MAQGLALVCTCVDAGYLCTLFCVFFSRDLSDRCSKQAFQTHTPKDDSARLLGYLILALGGLFKSIALTAGNTLEDTLRVLQLWFEEGHRPRVAATFQDGCAAVSLDTWLQVLPQLIARIENLEPAVQATLHELLARLGRIHPQALVFPLSVSSQNYKNLQNRAKKEAAGNLLNRVRALLGQQQLSCLCYF
jgi:FKBP12-rapamycin complex-associated protein